WDFSYVNNYGGNPDEPLPWSYRLSIGNHLAKSDYLLDMGTGGGEFLSFLRPLPKHTYATEAYKPNVGIAKKTLEPLGVKVVEIEEGIQEQSPLPFENNFFDLVINRHEYYEAKEVYRILKPRGHFITQQVGHKNNENLRIIFGTIDPGEDFVWELDTAVNHLKKANFGILVAQEYSGYSRFYDIRALVYLLKVLPWEFPGFTIEKYENQLFNIYIKLVDNGYFDTTLHRFFIVSQKS
ncbi:MAG: class I SAM-dependent methyltransferase, partial [Candidatus Hodarchaeota archaeon]